MVADRMATPLKGELEQGACRNPHGFGFAIIVGDKIISERTMKAERSIERFLMYREMYPEGVAIWHARIATHGGQNERNCHPFRVGGDERTYLAHNGVLHVPMAVGEHRSDSRVFADDILPEIGGVKALDNPSIRLMMETWVGSSKVAVLTVDPEAKAQCYIINEEAGKWDANNVWWSNQTHIKPKYIAPVVGSWESNRTYVPKPKGFYEAHRWDFETSEYVLRDDWYETSTGEYEREKILAPLLALVAPSDDDDELSFILCPICDHDTDLNFDPDYCLYCKSCFACEQTRLTCMCYSDSVWNGHFGY